MRAVPVTDRKTRKEFHRVAEIIYADDENYIPHLIQDIDQLFDVKTNKLLENGAAIRWVFYNHENKLIGRVAVFINPKAAYENPQPTGGMGFFECIDDQAVADFIFDKAKKWLEEKGMEAMDGPVNFGERDQFWGCLTKNFTDPNTYGSNYNPPYYPKLFENYGFDTYFTQYLFSRDVYEPVPEIFLRKLQILRKKFGVEARNMIGVSAEELTRDFLTVYNGAWVDYAGFKPMTLKTATELMKKLKPILDRRIVFFAYEGAKPIGFFINIPELNEIFKYVDGNMNWIGKLKFLYHKWRNTPRTMVGLIFGVVKEWHGRGIEGMMIYEAGQYLHPRDLYDRIVMTWIADFNPKMLHVAENIGSKPFREMKTYRYLFDRDKPFERHPVVE